MILTLVVFLLILTALVLIHELGHFLMARKFGIKVEEFGFGFPPKAFSIKRGETEYSINYLPIGGFVKLYGEDEVGGGQFKVQSFDKALGKSAKLKVKDEKRAFYAKPWQERAMVVIAGVFMNALLAVVIYYAYLFISNFHVQIPLLGQHEFFLVSQKTTTDVIVSDVAKDSPAQKAGIKPFSKIMSINGETISNTRQIINIVNKHRGAEITIVWRDTQANHDVIATVVPRMDPPKGQGAIGIAFFPQNFASLSYDTPMQKTFSGFIHPANLFVYNIEVLGKLVGASFAQKSAAPLRGGVAGPVGIYSLVGTIVDIPNIKEKVLQILNLSGILSISLAFFNLLPIPALDGGRFFFILIEAVSGRKVNQRFESMAHAVGMAVLLSLLVLITMQDIQRLLFR